MIRIKIRHILFLVAVFLFFSVTSAYAHRLNIFAKVDKGVVHVESYYSGGAKCKACKVEVFDPAGGKKLKDGLTDDNGVFLFKIENPSSLKIVVSDRMGHRGEHLIDKKDILNAP
mgnify:CR=1 FL=1